MIECCNNSIKSAKLNISTKDKIIEISKISDKINDKSTIKIFNERLTLIKKTYPKHSIIYAKSTLGEHKLGIVYDYDIDCLVYIQSNDKIDAIRISDILYEDIFILDYSAYTNLLKREKLANDLAESKSLNRRLEIVLIVIFIVIFLSLLIF